MSSLNVSRQQRSNKRHPFGSDQNIYFSAGGSSRTSLPEPRWPVAPSNISESKRSQSRRFHNFSEDGQGGLYFLPNDIEEQDRLQAQHYMLKLACGGNIFCPAARILKSGGTALDIGCAQGVWVADCAFEFPDAKFHGVDMTPIFPVDIKPQNVNFHKANVLECIPFPDNMFDLTAMRFLVFAFREKDEWPGVLAEIFRVTKPGGWVQLVEPDFYIWSCGPSTKEAIGKINTVIRKRGQNPHIARTLTKLLKNAGCTSIMCRTVSIPINWPINYAVCGMAATNIIDLLHGAKDLVVKTREVTEESWEALKGDILEECKKNKSYMNIHIFVGRKPGG